MSIPEDPQTRSTAAALGYGGLIPFVSLAAALLVDHARTVPWSHALFSYAALILSFVGALHWAFAMALPGMDGSHRSRLLNWSVIPALIAWVALLLSPAAASVLLISGFVLHFLQDRRLGSSSALPPWYLPMRLRLTLVASVCIGIGGLVGRY